MIQRSEAIEAVNQVINSRDNIKIDLEGEEFSTRIIHLDRNTGTFIADSIIPKYGDSRLQPEKVYVFRQNWYSEGVVYRLEFLSVYRSAADFNNLPSHIFNLPHEIIRKSALFDIRPSKADEVEIAFFYRGINILEKVGRINVHNIFFTYPENHQEIMPGTKIEDAALRLPQRSIRFTGRVRREEKYNYHLEIEKIPIDHRIALIRYIDASYRALMGFEKLNIEGQAVPKSGRKKVEDSSEGRGKIFVVDSDLLVTDIVSRALTGRGYQCFVFNDGSGVIEIAVKQQPEAIILALTLPGYDGLTILRRLKRNEETLDIPVVILTDSADKEDVLDASQAGASLYLIKSPEMDLEELCDKIEALLCSR